MSVERKLFSPVEAYSILFQEAQAINKVLFDKGYTPYQCCKICHMADAYWHMVMEQAQAEAVVSSKEYMKRGEKMMDNVEKEIEESQ